MEIIAEIDKRVYCLPNYSPPSFLLSFMYLYFEYGTVNISQFVAMIQKTQTDLESKLPSMRILDDNPQKPVVRMANLCVVSAHTVRILWKSMNSMSHVAHSM